MYSLAHSRVKKNKTSIWESMKGMKDEEGLKNLNIGQCTALTPPAVQAVCDSFPALHTCSGRHSLIMSGCLNLMSVHCACAVHAHRTFIPFPHPAHWTLGLQQKSMGTLSLCMYVCVNILKTLVANMQPFVVESWNLVTMKKLLQLCVYVFLYVNSTVVWAFRNYVVIFCWLWASC